MYRIDVSAAAAVSVVVRAVAGGGCPRAMMTLPPVVDGCPEFPDTFQDLFSKLDEHDESLASLLEDKLIPRGRRPDGGRRWVIPRRSFHRKPATVDHAGNPAPPEHPTSPTQGRQRSSSIAVTRTPPDLHRFLQTEQNRPWGHLSPAPSPAVSRPVSPRPHALPRGTYRSRTASMPVVPARHRVSTSAKLRYHTTNTNCTTQKPIISRF